MSLHSASFIDLNKPDLFETHHYLRIWLILATLIMHLQINFTRITLLVVSVSYVVAQTKCNQQQYRSAGDPSGQQISDALLGTNDATLNSVCSDGWPPGSQTTNTFNTGSLIYNVTRTDPNQPLK